MSCWSSWSKIESLADDILFFKELDVDMNGIGPFIPNEDTPLKDAEGGQFELALKSNGYS